MTPERLDALVGGGDPSEEEKHEYRRRLIARAEDGEADYDYGPGYSSTRSGTPTAGKSLRGDGEALFLLRRLEHLHGLFPSVQEALIRWGRVVRRTSVRTPDFTGKRVPLENPRGDEPWDFAPAVPYIG